MAGGVGGGFRWEGPQQAAVGTVAAELTYGLTDTWAGRLALQIDGPAFGVRRDRAGAATLGFVYAIDALRVIPFVDAGLALESRWGAGFARPGVGIDMGAGADYLLTRLWAVGLVVRGRWVPLGVPRDPATALLGLGLRLGRTF